MDRTVLSIDTYENSSKENFPSKKSSNVASRCFHLFLASLLSRSSVLSHPPIIASQETSRISRNANNFLHTLLSLTRLPPLSLIFPFPTRSASRPSSFIDQVRLLFEFWNFLVFVVYFVRSFEFCLVSLWIFVVYVDGDGSASGRAERRRIGGRRGAEVSSDAVFDQNVPARG